MKYLNSKIIKCRISSTEDLQAILNLLTECSLPILDIEPGKQSFIVAEFEGEMIGCAGLEVYGQKGLFRSLAIHSTYRNLNIGKLLTDEVLALGREKGISEFYLLTNTAEGFFKKLGWKVTDRNEVSSEISKSSEFASICPSTAICMKYTL
jgi:amino-acid N-acetyltransferase